MGTFSSVASTVPSLLEVIYEPDAVVVEVLPIGSLGLDSNAAAAASCYATGFIPGSDAELINAALLTLDAAGINQSFNQIQPSQYSGLAWIQIQNALLVRSSYTSHLETTTGCNSYIWGNAIGSWQKQNSSGQQFGYNDWTKGLSIGVDGCACDHFRIGMAASYTHSRLNWSKSAGHASINSYYGGAYANCSNGCGYITGSLIGAYSHYKTDRHLHFASIDRHANASHNSWECLTGLEVGFNFDYDACMIITPFASIDYIYLSEQGFLEKGADSLNLHVNKTQNQILQSELGIICSGQYVYGCVAGSFLPRIKLSYINDAPLKNHRLHASFVDSDCDFSVRGLQFCRNMGSAAIGLTYLSCDDNLAATLSYDGKFGHNYNNQTANIALNIKF